MTDVVTHVRNNLPRCLTGVTATPLDGSIADRGPLGVVFSISKPEKVRVLGYDLSEYNTDYAGPTEFISPLTLRAEDGTSACIFDSNIHGYNGEMDSSAKLRGTGDPREFKCPKCGCNTFNVDVQFDYYDDLLEEFEPAEVPNYFCNIIVRGTCSECSQQTSILDMDL